MGAVHDPAVINDAVVIGADAQPVKPGGSCLAKGAFGKRLDGRHKGIPGVKRIGQHVHVNVGEIRLRAVQLGNQVQVALGAVKGRGGKLLPQRVIADNEDVVVADGLIGAEAADVVVDAPVDFRARIRGCAGRKVGKNGLVKGDHVQIKVSGRDRRLPGDGVQDAAAMVLHRRNVHLEPLGGMRRARSIGIVGRGPLLALAAVGGKVVHAGQIIGRGVVQTGRIAGCPPRVLGDAGEKLRIDELALVFWPPGEIQVRVGAGREAGRAVAGDSVRVSAAAVFADEDGCRRGVIGGIVLIEAAVRPAWVAAD